MEKEITIGQAIGFVVTLGLGVLAWGNSIQKDTSENSVRIQILEQNNKYITDKLDKIADKTEAILIELQNKKNKN